MTNYICHCACYVYANLHVHVLCMCVSTYILHVHVCQLTFTYPLLQHRMQLALIMHKNQCSIYVFLLFVDTITQFNCTIIINFRFYLS